MTAGGSDTRSTGRGHVMVMRSQSLSRQECIYHDFTSNDY